MDSTPHRRFYLLTQPRTCSNLLTRILSFGDQPAVARSAGAGQGYFFLPPFELREQLKLGVKTVEEWTQDAQDQMKQSYQRCFEELQKYVEAGEAEGQIVFVKEHVYFLTDPTAMSRFVHGRESVKQSPWTVQVPSVYGTEVTHSSLNNTLLPDEFLQTWLPIFLIRHPALMFPSHFRTIRDAISIEAAHAEGARSASMTLHWTRTLYDWYMQHPVKPRSGPESGSDWPVLLDADDILNDPNVIVRLCEIVGMDSTKLQFEWQPANKEELAQLRSDISRRMLSTLSSSAGVLKDKSATDIDISAEAKKWKEEFGQSDGEKVEGWVRAAMPDYEYLKAKRLQARTASGLSKLFCS